MYRYNYGEADGPFKCEFNDGSHRVKSGCDKMTWCIYAEKNYEDSRRPLMVGIALCDEHSPKEINVRRSQTPPIQEKAE